MRVTDERVSPFRDLWPCWSSEGWEAAAEWSVQDATKVTRAQAHAAATPDFDWTEVGVWKRYIRTFTRQERYEWWVESRTDEGWEGVPEGGVPGRPDVPPDNWDEKVVMYDEDAPQWEFVHRSHPEAWPVWVVGELRLGAPHNPDRAGGSDR